MQRRSQLLNSDFRGQFYAPLRRLCCANSFSDGLPDLIVHPSVPSLSECRWAAAKNGVQGSSVRTQWACWWLCYAHRTLLGGGRFPLNRIPVAQVPLPQQHPLPFTSCQSASSRPFEFRYCTTSLALVALDSSPKDLRSQMWGKFRQVWDSSSTLCGAGEELGLALRTTSPISFSCISDMSNCT